MLNLFLNSEVPIFQGGLMGNTNEEAVERVSELLKKAKSTGRGKEAIHPVALERIADEFELPIEKVHEMLQAEAVT